MGNIRTVTGDIPAEALGWCQCHEHIFIADGPSATLNPALRIDDEDKTRAELVSYRRAGGCSLVDAQPFACGRMAGALYSAGLQTGVHIVASTGFHKTEFFEDIAWLDKQTEDSLAGIYSAELCTGMLRPEGSGPAVCAGIIKCAAVKNEHRADQRYEKLFYAAATAAKMTGAPLMVHMDPGADALPLIRFFTDRGIAPGRIAFCHLDRTRYDFGYHEEVCAAGVFLEYDTIHREKYHSDAEEISLIAHMAGRGFASRLLFSLDTTRQRLKSYGAPFGLDYILTDFAASVDRTIGKGETSRIMKRNSMEFLQWEPESCNKNL